MYTCKDDRANCRATAGVYLSGQLPVLGLVGAHLGLGRGRPTSPGAARVQGAALEQQRLQPHPCFS